MLFRRNVVEKLGKAQILQIHTSLESLPKFSYNFAVMDVHLTSISGPETTVCLVL